MTATINLEYGQVINMRLHEQVTQQAEVIAAYEEHIMALNTYINSSKFDYDTTVQVSDISLRLTELRLAIWSVE